MTALTPQIVLIGPPGAGKSTVGHTLAQRLGVALRDTDQDVETTTGRAISEIFVEDGEEHFRDLERTAVATALTEHDGVLALGGGAVLDPTTQDRLLSYRSGGGHVVFLDLTLTHAVRRVGLNVARPLLLGNTRAQWKLLMDARRPIYTRLASLTVLTDELQPAEVADQILAELGIQVPGQDEDGSPDA